MVWNKRGNTGGGVSSGKDARGRVTIKRGGSGRTPLVDEGPTELIMCPRCLGEGQIGNPAVEQDEDGNYTGRDLQQCPRCGGTGRVKKK
jgi:hypothetical protein